jgi:PTH1 family peptidyl-tRNA hydrolase
VADYVLNSPSPSDRELIEDALARCMNVSRLLLDGEMQAAMLKLHTDS